MPNSNFQPEGYGLGRDVQMNAIASGGISGYFLSESVRNFQIQQSGTDFYFRRWLSAQSNFNLFPYATDATVSGAKYTRISNPTFALDAGEYLDVTGSFYFTWVYLKSTAATANDEILYYKSNCTGRGTINKATGDANYYFLKTGINQAVKVDDYIYASFTSDNTDITVHTGLVCPFSTWYGSFFRVTDISVADQITMVEDNTIAATLYPATNVTNFVKNYPVGNPDLVGVYSMVYDLGYCFNRPSEPNNYYRPIAITIDEARFTQSYENNGIITTIDNYNTGSEDRYINWGGITSAVFSFNYPICRSTQFEMDIMLDAADDPFVYLEPLGASNASAVTGLGYRSQIIVGAMAYNLFMVNTCTRGLPIFKFLINPGSAGALLNVLRHRAFSADYQLGRI